LSRIDVLALDVVKLVELVVSVVVVLVVAVVGSIVALVLLPLSLVVVPVTVDLASFVDPVPTTTPSPAIADDGVSVVVVPSKSIGGGDVDGCSR